MKKAFLVIGLVATLLTGSVVGPLSASAQSTGGGGTDLICGLIGALNAPPFSVPPISLGPIGVIRNMVGTNRVWYNQTLCQFAQRVYDRTNPGEIFGERYTHAQVTWIFHSVVSFVMNSVYNFVMGFFGQITQGPSSQSIADLNAGSLTRNTISFMFTNHPASFIGSVQEFLGKFSLAAPAHAQGYGYNSLQGVRPLWAASRNMAYLLMVVMLIVVGFMIMFRIKINAQAAVTLQLMIPKIAFTLLAITFSYAIAGFMIDLVYVALGFIIFILGTQGVYRVTPAAVLAYFSAPDILPVIGYFFQLTTLLNLILTVIVPVIGGFIMPIIFIVLFSRIIWMMVKSYIYLLIQVIIGPWIILLGLIPVGSFRGGMGKWLTDLLSNALVFLVVPLMIILSLLILAPTQGEWFAQVLQWIQDRMTGGIFTNGVDPGINGIDISNLPALPLFGASGAIGATVFRFILGFGVLAVIPSVAKTLQEALKASKMGYESAIGEALGAPMAAWGMYNAARTGVGLGAQTPLDLGRGAWGLANRIVRGRGGGGTGTAAGSTPTISKTAKDVGRGETSGA